MEIHQGSTRSTHQSEAGATEEKKMIGAEGHIARKYKQEGWLPMHKGAPDFLMLKMEEGKIIDFCFVEVKNDGDILTPEQSIYKWVLKELGTKYHLENTNIKRRTGDIIGMKRKAKWRLTKARRDSLAKVSRNLKGRRK